MGQVYAPTASDALAAFTAEPAVTRCGPPSLEGGPHRGLRGVGQPVILAAYSSPSSTSVASSASVVPAF